jgi:tRNA(Ile)-lysidine synthase
LNNYSFEKRFEKFVSDEKLFSADTKILLALSGGVDSVVLLNLFYRSKVKFTAAHCNFQLRSLESENDEEFVRKLTSELEIPLFVKKFETESFAKSQKISIQEAARAQRYDWFTALLAQVNFDLIATAHHLDDSIETVLFNLSNGCGISGLHGILPLNQEKKLIRPLMFASKKDILAFASENGINFREDSSNSSDKYNRNLIRHQVLPVLEAINHGFVDNFARSIRNFKETEVLQKFAIEKIKTEICEELSADELLKINLEPIFDFPSPLTVLFELIKSYGFNRNQAEQILEQAHNSESALYHAEFYIIIRNYKKLRVFEKADRTTLSESVISAGVSEIMVNEKQKIIFEVIPKEQFDCHPKNKNLAFFDADKIEFPFLLRYYRNGDSFRPFGMSGKLKKLSSFFKDEKIPEHKRSTVPLLVSDSKIIWVIGYRSSIDFSVTTDTNMVLKLSLVES